MPVFLRKISLVEEDFPPSRKDAKRPQSKNKDLLATTSVTYPLSHATPFAERMTLYASSPNLRLCGNLCVFAGKF